jgi:hypothetical protein
LKPCHACAFKLPPKVCVNWAQLVCTASPAGPGGNPNGSGVITLTTVCTTLPGTPIIEDPIAVMELNAAPASAPRRSMRGRDDSDSSSRDDSSSASPAAARALRLLQRSLRRRLLRSWRAPPPPRNNNGDDDARDGADVCIAFFVTPSAVVVRDGFEYTRRRWAMQQGGTAATSEYMFGEPPSWMGWEERGGRSADVDDVKVGRLRRRVCRFFEEEISLVSGHPRPICYTNRLQCQGRDSLMLTSQVHDAVPSTKQVLLQCLAASVTCLAATEAKRGASSSSRSP